MKGLIIFIIVVVVLVGLALVFDKTEAPAVPDMNNTESLLDEAENSSVTDTDQTTEGEVKEFKVTGDNFSFSVEEMNVNVGDTVRVVFENVDTAGMKHDWVIDEFNARTEILDVGETETIEFVASEAGTYEYYCSVGQHRANGMVGTLIVE